MNHDLYAETTARIVAALERGVAPWVRPWSTLAEAIPMNAQSKRQYRGVNFTLLTLEAEAHGYPINRWLTYRQAAELGGQVRRGEQGTTVVFWQLKKDRGRGLPGQRRAGPARPGLPAAARLYGV